MITLARPPHPFGWSKVCFYDCFVLSLEPRRHPYDHWVWGQPGWNERKGRVTSLAPAVCVPLYPSASHRLTVIESDPNGNNSIVTVSSEIDMTSFTLTTRAWEGGGKRGRDAAFLSNRKCGGYAFRFWLFFTSAQHLALFTGFFVRACAAKNINESFILGSFVNDYAGSGRNGFRSEISYDRIATKTGILIVTLFALCCVACFVCEERKLMLLLLLHRGNRAVNKLQSDCASVLRQTSDSRGCKHFEKV